MFINCDLWFEVFYYCLFWWFDLVKLNNNVWYDNGSKKVEILYRKLDDSMCWGLFFEWLMYCDVGKKVGGGGDVDSFIVRFVVFYVCNEIWELFDGDFDGEDGIYVFVIE